MGSRQIYRKRVQSGTNRGSGLSPCKNPKVHLPSVFWSWKRDLSLLLRLFLLINWQSKVLTPRSWVWYSVMSHTYGGVKWANVNVKWPVMVYHLWKMQRNQCRTFGTFWTPWVYRFQQNHDFGRVELVLKIKASWIPSSWHVFVGWAPPPSSLPRSVPLMMPASVLQQMPRPWHWDTGLPTPLASPTPALLETPMG